MKNVFLTLAAVATLGLASCTKSYTCTCTYVSGSGNNATTYTTTTTLNKTSASDAQAVCPASTVNSTVNGGQSTSQTQTCTLS